MVTAVGEAVRSLRRGLGVTIDLLAERSQLSVGVVSQLERGIGNPSFATLVQLAHGLDVPVGRLFHIDERTSPVVRKAERRRLGGHDAPTGNATYELLTPDLSGALEAHWVTASPGHDTSRNPFRHNGEEFGVVISGAVDVYVDGTKYHLDEGDSIRFSSTVPHWFVNPTGVTTHSVWVSTPPTW
jgi:transcriptional regulator with XRE-family HTH domain